MTLVALTGSTGFIGQHLLDELPKRGYRVRVLLRRPAAQEMPFGGAVIGDLTRPQNLKAALTGVDYVIHSAAGSSPMSGQPEDDFRRLDTQATMNLALAAERARIKRFVFFSSVRAQVGPSASKVISEADEPQPNDAYGRSKLAAEQALSELGIDWVAVRPVLVFGRGVKGNFATLMRLARSPYPLPLRALDARRSLLSVQNLADAVDTVLACDGTLRRAFLVADDDPLTVPEIIQAMREGLGRPRRLFSVPAKLLETALRLGGREDWIPRLTGPLVVDTSAIKRLGWAPRLGSRTALRNLMSE